MNITIKEYIKIGHMPFADWFNDLDHIAAAKVNTALYRLAQGNRSNFKSVGEGVWEYKIDFGPGRTGTHYFSKKQQSKDIAAAKQRWHDYKKCKTMRDDRWL